MEHFLRGRPQLRLWKFNSKEKRKFVFVFIQKTVLYFVKEFLNMKQTWPQIGATSDLFLLSSKQ